MPTLPKRLFANAYLLLTLTALMWAGNSIVSKVAVGQVSPMALTVLRWGLVLAALLTLRGAETRANLASLKPHWRWVALMGMTGYASFNALLYAAGHYTSAVNMTILQGSLPVFILIGGLVVFQARIGALQAIGALVTLVGVAAIASGGDAQRLFDLAFNFGDLLLIAACVLYAGYTQGLRRRPAVSGFAVFTGFAAAAFLASLPLLAIEMAMGQFHAPTAFGWVLTAYAVIGPSFLAQIFYIRGVELIGPARAGLFINLVPVFGAGLAVMLLGEPFGLHHAIALVLVLGGIALAEWGKAA